MGCSVTSLVFQPPGPKKRAPSYSIYLETESGNKVPAKFFNLGREYTILMSHGNAEDINQVEDWVNKTLIHSVNANVMIYEYSGYHNRDIEPSEEFVYSDAEAAFGFLVNVIKIQTKKIVLYGRSLGSGPCCYLAEKYDVGGLILQTPLSSIYRVILDFRFTLPGDMFPNIDRIGKIRCPMLIIHGTRDEIVPMQHSVDLYEACKSQHKYNYYVEGAGHNNIESIAGGKLFESMQNFVEFLKT
jgi:fermentation-respiration switch protein FrsA (DUF1100 family)